MTPAERALAFAVRHAELSAEIQVVAGQITPLNDERCDGELPPQNEYDPGTPSCLAQALTADPHPLNIAAYLLEIEACDTCAQLYTLIRKRRILRRQLSNLRSSITRLGRAQLQERT